MFFYQKKEINKIFRTDKISNIGIIQVTKVKDWEITFDEKLLFKTNVVCEKKL